MHGEVLVRGAQTCHKVILERLNGSLGRVTAMVVGWYELVIDAFGFDRSFECRGGLVVHFLELRFESSCYQDLMEIVVCS